MSDNFYKVYYLNVWKRTFPTRDEAMSYIIREAAANHRGIDDYEILDRSDF